MATILEGYERVTGSMPTGKQYVDRSTGLVVDEIRNYDNYIIHYSSSDRETVKGKYCDNVKASVDKLQIIGGKIEDLVGKPVILGFDVTAKADSNGRIRPALTSIVCLDAGGAKK